MKGLTATAISRPFVDLLAASGLLERRRGLLIAFMSLVFVLVPSVALAAEEASPSMDPLTAELQAIVDRLPEAVGEDDASEMRSLIGPPDAFTVAFERTDDGAVSRREEWFYYDLATVFEFVDGAVLWDWPLDAEVDFLVHPVRYDPGDFDAEATWESLAQVVGDPSAFEAVALDPEYEVPATIYVGNLLLLAFDEEGKLFYVEAVPVTPAEVS